jgi:signal transduction histidine kinase
MHRLSSSQKTFRSLTKTLTIATLGLSVFILVGISSIQLYLSYKSQKSAITSQQQAIGQRAAGTVQSFVQQRIAILQTATKLSDPLATSKSQQLQTLDKLISLEPAFNRVGLLDANRQETSISIRLADVGSKNVADRVDQDQLFATVKAGNTYISNVYISHLTNEPLILIAVPVRNVYGDFRGVIAAETNLKFMWDLVGNIKVNTHGQAYVVDRQGKLIAYGDSIRALKGENLSRLTEVKQFMISKNNSSDSQTDISAGINNTRVVSTYTPLGTPDWAVITEVPFLEAYHSFIQDVWQSAAVIVLVAALIIVASIWIARWITRPLLSLRDAANEIGAGNLATRVHITTNNEVGEVAKAFDEMASALQQSNHAVHSEQAKLKASIESLSVGFMLIDEKGDIVMRNKALTTILDLQREQISLDAIVSRFTDHADIIRKFQKAYDDHLALELKDIAYGTKILRIVLSPVMAFEGDDASAVGSVVLVEDVTEERNLDRSKDEFFSIASHELRTPLTAIKGNASLIMGYYRDQLKDPALQEMVDDIHESSTRLIEIVNDFLDVSRLEQGKMIFKTEVFGIDKTIKSVVNEMQAMMQQKNIDLSVDGRALQKVPLVWADPDRTKQIVYNLVGNAAKFTEKGSIRINVVPQRKFIKVLISDDGRGISPEGQALLFHKFQQTGDSLLTRDTTRGTGLGLYISKMMAEKMGGSMRLEHSEVGKGTTFSFTLPIADGRHATASNTTTTFDSATGLTTK